MVLTDNAEPGHGAKLKNNILISTAFNNVGGLVEHAVQQGLRRGGHGQRAKMGRGQHEALDARGETERPRSPRSSMTPAKCETLVARP